MEERLKVIFLRDSVKVMQEVGVESGLRNLAKRLSGLSGSLDSERPDQSTLAGEGTTTTIDLGPGQQTLSSNWKEHLA